MQSDDHISTSVLSTITMLNERLAMRRGIPGKVCIIENPQNDEIKMLMAKAHNTRFTTNDECKTLKVVEGQ